VAAAWGSIVRCVQGKPWTFPCQRRVLLLDRDAGVALLFRLKEIAKDTGQAVQQSERSVRSPVRNSSVPGGQSGAFGNCGQGKRTTVDGAAHLATKWSVSQIRVGLGGWPWQSLRCPGLGSFPGHRRLCPGHSAVPLNPTVICETDTKRGFLSRLLPHVIRARPGLEARPRSGHDSGRGGPALQASPHL